MDISESAVEKIKALSHKADAEIIHCLLPLGSIFWSDELPDSKLRFHEFKGDDHEFVMRLFAIRIGYWNDGVIPEEDRAFWEQAKTRFPDWPIFQRLEFTATAKAAHEEVEREFDNFLSVFSNEADEFTITQKNDHFSSFSATFDLTKDANTDDN